jgi:hypothetical protein
MPSFPCPPSLLRSAGSLFTLFRFVEVLDDPVLAAPGPAWPGGAGRGGVLMMNVPMPMLMFCVINFGFRF